MALSDRFRLVRLEREELLVASKEADYAQWGAPGRLGLDLAQYQAKERAQRQTRFARRGSSYWALVDRAAGDDGASDSDEGLSPDRTVWHCLCKTHRFACAFRARSGDVTRGFAFQVGSVFTRPESRRQGLAAFFLAQVRRRLQERPGALVSALYSIIGPEFYDRLGWRLYPSTLATLDADHPRNVAAATSGTLPQEQPLYVDGALDELLAADNARLVQQLAGEQLDGKEAFVLLPSRDSVEWQFAVGVAYARAHGRQEQQLPSVCGVRLAGSGAFLVWCHNLKEGRLYVLRARFEDADAAVQLFRAALREARAFQLRQVVIWNPPEALQADEVATKLQVEHGPRELSCSSAIVFNAPNDPADLPVWLANERFSWV